MTCKQIKENIPAILSGELDSSAMARVKDHLSVCPCCRAEIEHLSEIWIKLEVLPEEQPDATVRKRFYALLKSYRRNLTQDKNRTGWKRFIAKARDYLPFPRPWLQFAAVALMVTMGFVAGYLVSSPGTVNRENRSLKQEIRNIRQTAAIFMLQQESASDRLNGVQWSSRILNPDDKTLQVLMVVLNNDPSTNVRLAAADALYLFSDNPAVKEGLIRSLSLQQNPIVQVALIDLMVDICEKRAVHAIKQLMASEIIHPEVRDFARNSLKKLSEQPRNTDDKKTQLLSA